MPLTMEWGNIEHLSPWIRKEMEELEEDRNLLGG